MTHHDVTIGRILARREVLALLGRSAGAAILSAYVRDLLVRPVPPPRRLGRCAGGGR